MPPSPRTAAKCSATIFDKDQLRRRVLGAERLTTARSAPQTLHRGESHFLRVAKNSPIKCFDSGDPANLMKAFVSSAIASSNDNNAPWIMTPSASRTAADSGSTAGAKR